MKQSRFGGSYPVCSRPNRILAVTPSDEDESTLQRILGSGEWQISRTCTCEQARAVLGDERVILIICERELPDGTWKDLLQGVLNHDSAPLLIVVSQLADDALWAEVLNLGGHDVLPKPLDDREVLWSVTMACEHWIDQQHPRSAATLG